MSEPQTRTKYAYDAAGRPATVTSSLVDAQHPATLYAVDPSIGYFPSGAVRKATLANGLTESAMYNNRLQPCRMEINSTAASFVQCTDPSPSGNLLDFTYGYNTGSSNNGNVASWSAAGNQTFTRSYGYDTLNRLSSMSDTAASQACKGLSWTVDPWGNLTDQSVTSGSCLTLHVGVGTNNRLSSPYQYDAAGNMTYDGTHNYTYDAENRLTQVDSGSTAKYTYDSEGHRVGNSSGGVNSYIYGIDGNVVADVSSTGGWIIGYVYFGNSMVAQYFAGTTYSIFRDHLGSTRLITKLDKTVADSLDFLPFGAQTAGDTTSPHKFTGKERDSESGLDDFGARYMGSGLGRFMSSDSTAYVKPINPQSWNLYAYARNNPLLYVDPTGNTVSLANCKDKSKCAQVLTNAAQLPKGVTAEVDKKGNLVLKGDLSQIKGGNAARLLQLVQSDKTASFWIGDKAPGLSSNTQPVGGGLSGTTTQGYNQNFAVVQADPSRVDSGDLGGVFLNPDGSTTAGQIPGTDIDEAAAHELLGHVWADLIGSASAGTEGNLKEALIAEDRVRNTDPSRGLKIRHQDSPQLIKATDLPRITNPGSQP